MILSAVSLPQKPRPPPPPNPTQRQLPLPLPLRESPPLLPSARPMMTVPVRIYIHANHTNALSIVQVSCF
jgi:hypothetical protein